MDTLSQIISGEAIRIEVGMNNDDLVKTTGFLSVGIFVAVLLAVLIANKI